MYLPSMVAIRRKLLLVTRDVDGGLGQHFVDLAEGMAARGWEVHCVRARRVEGHVTGHSAHLDDLTGVAVHTIPLARAIGLGDLRSYLEFRRIVKRHGPFDIAHGHGAKGGVFVRLPCRGIRSSVYTPHGLMTLDRSLPALKAVVYGLTERVFARFLTDAILAVSTKEYQEALRLGTPKVACHKIPNGMRCPEFLLGDRARIGIGLEPEHRVAMFIGRFCREKAPERFVSLIAALAPRFPELRGVLIGGGESKPEVVELAAALGVSDRLIFFETSRASTYMRAADLLVVPSRLEGFAYTMIEALAAGLPIVSYDVGGADDLVVDARTGYVVPQGDEGALAFRAGEIIDSPDLQSSMAKAARDVFERFELDTMLERIANVYGSLRKPLVHGTADMPNGTRRLSS